MKIKAKCNGRNGETFEVCPFLINQSCNILSIVDYDAENGVGLYTPDHRKINECKAKMFLKPTKRSTWFATELINIYSDIINVGFNEDQALQILCSIAPILISGDFA